MPRIPAPGRLRLEDQSEKPDRATEQDPESEGEEREDTSGLC